MVEEILEKGHPRSSRVKFSTTTDLHELHHERHIKSFVLLCAFQKCILLLHFDIYYIKIKCKRICTVIVAQEVPMYKPLIFLLQKNQ